MAALTPVTFELSKEMMLALGRAAQATQSSPSDYLRAVLRTALESSPVRLRGPDEEMRLAIALASDWLDLQRRLRAEGHVLRLSEAGLRFAFLAARPGDTADRGHRPQSCRSGAALRRAVSGGNFAHAAGGSAQAAGGVTNAGRQQGHRP